MQVKRDAGVEFHASQDGAAVGIDHQGFANFGELRPFQTGDQDWNCGRALWNCASACGAISVMHTSLPSSAGSRCHRPGAGRMAGRSYHTSKWALGESLERSVQGVSGRTVQAAILGNWRWRAGQRAWPPPPSTTRAAPVIQLDMGLARNKTAFAISSGVPTRASGRFAASRMKLANVVAELSAFAAQHGRVDVARADAVDANIVLAVIDGHGAGQIHRAAFRCAVGSGSRASLQRPSEPMLMMLPPPLRIMCGTTSRESR